MPLVASAGTTADITKNNTQRKLIYDGTHWWVFYMKSGSANTLFYAYSSDLSTWTEASVAFTGLTVLEDGGTLDAIYDAASGVVLVQYYESVAYYWSYLRGVISGTTITWGTTGGNPAGNNQEFGPQYAAKLFLDSSNIPCLIDTINGNPDIRRATNAIGTSFSDQNWTAVGSGLGINDFAHRLWGGPLASQNLVIIFDDISGSTVTVNYSTWNGAAWSAATALVSGTTVARENWAVVPLSTTDVRWLGISATNTFSYQKYNGSAWSTLTAPTWPAGGVKTDGLVLITDGTDVWLFVIQNDSANTISYNKYSGTSWSGWSNLITSTATRSALTSARDVAGSRAVIGWTEVNGSNYDIYVDGLSLVTYQYARPIADAAQGSWANETGGSALYTSIDEVTTDDADYIKSSNPASNDTCRVQLASQPSPGAGTVSIIVRHSKP